MYIQLKDIDFKYDNSKELTLNAVSFEALKGEIISIFGESGSGKSTLLRIMAGLEIPKSGLLRIERETIVDDRTFVSPEKRQIGMVFQDYALFPHMSVWDNIKFGLKGRAGKDIKNRVEETLELIQMSRFKNKYPYQLSGGQQQRVALGRAIAPKPKIILLDEPFSNLDTMLKCSIREELKRIFTKEQMTVVFVSHDIEDCKCLADRVIMLRDGVVEKILMNNDFVVENCCLKIV